MKYLVLGVGNVGKVIIRDLLNSSGVDGVLAVDYNYSELNDFASKIDDPRLEVEKGDIRDIDLTASQMKKADIVVNATWYEYNLHAIKAAIKAGRDMVDLGGLYWMTREELKMNDEVREAGITVVIGVGDDPGTSNVLVGYGASKMDSVDEIHIRWGSAGESSEGSMFGFSVLTVLDEATMPAVLYLNGRYIEAPPLSFPETTYFPDPIGYQKTFAIIHSELATLPYTIPNVKTVTYKDTWDESVFPILDFLRNVGLTSREEVPVGECMVSPQKLLASLTKPGEPEDVIGALRVELVGWKDGVKSRLLYFVGPVGYHEEWEAGVTAYTTGVGASIGAQALAEGLFPEKGVVPPEKITEPIKWVKELSRKGIPVIEISSIETRI